MKRFTTIKDISDSRRMPRLGKVRLGAKLVKNPGTESAVEYPTELPFFLLPDEVAAVHGFKLRAEEVVANAKDLGVTRADVLGFIKENAHRLAEELPVMIPVEETADSFPQSYKMYGSGAGLKCHGDGENGSERVGTSNEWKDITCPCSSLKSDENPKGACSRMAHLSVILPDVAMGGVYQIDTGSINSIIDINSGLEMVRSMIGRVAMIPLKLKRIKTETHHDGKKQIHFTCQLVVEGTINAIIALAENTALLSHNQVLLIEEPDYINPEVREPDGVYVQPERITKMIDELRGFGEVKKLKVTEAKAIAAALEENNDTAIEAIYKEVVKRVGGKTADDLADTLTQNKG